MQRMEGIKIVQCEGEGQGSCDTCNEQGIWNRKWMCMLYNIAEDGKIIDKKCYCREHAKEAKKYWENLRYRQEWGIFE